MTPCWHDGALDALEAGDRAVVWSIDAGSPTADRAIAGTPRPSRI